MQTPVDRSRCRRAGVVPKVGNSILTIRTGPIPTVGLANAGWQGRGFWVKTAPVSHGFWWLA